MSWLGRTRARRILNAVALTLITTGGVWAFAIEPYALEVTHHVVQAPLAARLRILQLSDLHTHGFGRRERRVVEIVEAEHPDAIVVTGDVVDGGDLAPARALFERLHAPRGVWVTKGNWEHWRPPPNVAAFWSSVGARLLVNAGVQLAPGVWLAAVDDPLAGVPDVNAALATAPAGAYRVLLLHAPEWLDRTHPPVDLALAGHSHGGQVRLPWLGALWLPPGTGRFVAGWYDVGRTRAYVSRGVGTSILPVRMLCRPEVAVFDVGG